MFHLLSLIEKWQSYYEKNSKNYYYQKNYFISKLPKISTGGWDEDESKPKCFWLFV